MTDDRIEALRVIAIRTALLLVMVIAHAHARPADHETLGVKVSREGNDYVFVSYSAAEIGGSGLRPRRPDPGRCATVIAASVSAAIPIERSATHAGSGL